MLKATEMARNSPTLQLTWSLVRVILVSLFKGSHFNLFDVCGSARPRNWKETRVLGQHAASPRYAGKFDG